MRFVRLAASDATKSAREHNSDESVVGLQDSPDGRSSGMSVKEDGYFTVTDSLNNVSKSFSA